MNSHHSSGDTSFKSQFASRFLQSLSEMIETNSASSMVAEEAVHQRLRYRKVRVAADASMAVAAGPRRAWSRALLRNLRSHPRTHYRYRAMMSRRRRRRGRSQHGKRRNGDGMDVDVEQEEEEEEELRRLVPGGEGMELRRLLEETGDYINCLTTQVQVMTTIANLISAA